MGIGVGSGERRPSLGGMVLRNSETRWYSCVDVNVTKNDNKMARRRQWAQCQSIHEWWGGQETASTRGHMNGPAWWKIVATVHTLSLPIPNYLQNPNFMYSTIRPPAHLPPLGPQNSWSSIVYHLSLTLTSFLTHLQFQSSFPLNPLSITLTLFPSNWHLNPDYIRVSTSSVLLRKQLNTPAEKYTTVLTSLTLIQSLNISHGILSFDGILPLYSRSIIRPTFQRQQLPPFLSSNLHPSNLFTLHL